MIKRLYILIIVSFCIMQCACTQSKTNILGSWILVSNYETPDIIIFRSDYKYYVYNSNSVNIESLGLKKNLHGYDILINDSYTTITEKGIWVYNEKSDELILKERIIIDEESDFRHAYGNADVLTFKLDKITQDKIELCYKKQGKTICDIYEKNWSYTDNSGDKVFYQEVTKEFVGMDSQIKEMVLSGYETELNIKYDFLKEPDKLIIKDGRGELIYSTKEMKSTDGWIKKELNLKGVTKLVFEIVSSQPISKWKINIELK